MSTNLLNKIQVCIIDIGQRVLSLFVESNGWENITDEFEKILEEVINIKSE